MEASLVKEKKHSRVILLWILAVLLGACLLCYCFLRFVVFTGEHNPKPAFDLTNVPAADLEWPCVSASIKNEDGSVEIVKLPSYEDKAEAVLYLRDVPYLLYGEIKLNNIKDVVIQGYLRREAFYEYLFSFNNLKSEEWLIDLPSRTKDFSISDYDTAKLWQAVTVEEIPAFITENVVATER